MSAQQGDNVGGTHSRWRQVFELGEQLIYLGEKAFESTIVNDLWVSEQRELIISATERLFDAQVKLWLAPERWHSLQIRPVGKVSQEVKASMQPEHMLMHHSWESYEPYALCPDGEMRSVQLTPGVLPDGCIEIAIPLLAFEQNQQSHIGLGVLHIARKPETLAFTPEDFELIDGLASQIVIAIQADLRIRRERWRLDQLALVRQVSNQIANVRDLDELARRVTRLILDTFDYYYVAILTIEPGWDTLHFRASASAQLGNQASLIERSPALLVRRGEGIIGSVAQGGEEILATDVRHEQRYLHQNTLPETRSEVALPLKIEDQILGVLDVQSDQLDDFDETDMLVLRALANNIAYAVKGTRLYSTLHHRATQLSIIQEVSQAITSILDQTELLNKVVDLIQQRFGFSYVHMFTVHPGRGKVVYEASSGARSQELREALFAYDLDDPQGLVPWVARHGETVLANDVSLESRYRPSPLPPDETRSELTVPLKFGGQVLGVLDIQSDQIEAFDNDDRFLFETLGDNIAVTLRNASLYRSESWRRQVADSLREVAGLLSADTDLDHVLNAILVELERTLPLDLAAIWLLEEVNSENEQPDATLYLAAVRGLEVVDLEIELGLRPEDVLAFNPPPGEILDGNTAATWLLEALTSSNPVVRSPHSLFEPLGASLDYPGNYSAIGAPLRAGERALGVLVLANRETGRYGSEARSMTAAFASYAAAAIENARLYEAAHEQAWVSTVLLQVAEATQVQTSLEELLDTVIRITPTLSGVRACLLYLLDEAGGFSPAAASGLASEQQVVFERQRFTPEETPVLARLLEHGGPQIIYGNDDDQDLLSILYPSDTKNTTPLLVLVPLVARGEVIGTFLVDYSLGSWSGIGGALEVFFDERLAIIQGIAQQTALAVQNVQLFKAQKEEAYILVALLQVAQAIVSSGDLDEILGSIVRITPILVGVERSAIYLWDANNAKFNLAQAYGIPHQYQTATYTDEDFPFIYSVVLRGQLMAHPVSALSMQSQGSIIEWSSATVLDPDEVEVYLDTDTRLLIAFPLSVKGQVLGVFLVEEPEIDNETTMVGTYLRLRQKRLEIITGISQQAALAIQNDQLQSEMVERERLEREMQLAREIQQAFLPKELPEAPGWELTMRWRTAREVGGDFYDAFELPNGRLGFVIADVADKGMPAALFMTLVRTLVRATVQDLEAPHEVLQRVNDIIEPDAPQGMFVTLAYAVLDLESGTLEYANAGHNPPLIVNSQEHRLQRLDRTGMALGVMAGIQIESRQTTIAPGDFLIFYTDGVTEAFSPEGEMFGEEHLYQTIEIAALGSNDETGSIQASAGHLLDAIDCSVSEFIGDAPLSDDLTLLIVKHIR